MVVLKIWIEDKDKNIIDDIPFIPGSRIYIGETFEDNINSLASYESQSFSILNENNIRK